MGGKGKTNNEKEEENEASLGKYKYFLCGPFI